MQLFTYFSATILYTFTHLSISLLSCSIAQCVELNSYDPYDYILTATTSVFFSFDVCIIFFSFDIINVRVLLIIIHIIIFITLRHKHLQFSKNTYYNVINTYNFIFMCLILKDLSFYIIQLLICYWELISISYESKFPLHIH